MDTDNTQQLQLTQAQAELVKLQQTISQDAGPLVLTLAIDRLTGHANVARGPLMVGHEAEDLDLLANYLLQVVKQTQDAKVEAIVAERLKANSPVGASPSSNGHHEPVSGG
jgi:hypothetical protein